MTKCAVLMLLPETYKRQTAAMEDRHMRRSAYWKAGESELICLHGGLRLCRLISAEWRKTLGLIFEIFTEKKKISFPFK